MFFASLQHAVFAVSLLSQVVLGTLPEMNEYGNTGYLQTMPGGLIAGIYLGNGGVSDADLARLALQASTDAISIAIKNNLPIPKGVSVFLSATSAHQPAADLLIAAIGGGTGNHGEPNVVSVAQAKAVDLDNGHMFTYTRDDGFIPPCGKNSDSGCKALFKKYKWVDISGEVGAAYKTMGAPNPPSPPRSPRAFTG